MASNVLKNLVLAIFVLQTVYAATKAQELAVRDLNLTTTSRTDDYAIQNQRQYDAVILSMEAELADFQANYQQQLNAINVQTDLIEDKLLAVEQQLNPLELLDDLSKHCVQKYRSKITTVATVKSTQLSCVNTAITSLSNFVSPPRTTINTLINYYRTNVKTVQTSCKKTHPISQFNYTVCVTNTITAANTYTITYQKKFATDMQVAKCSADGRIKTALDCSFTSFYGTISLVGETTRLIDNCIAGLEFCAPCPSAPTGSVCANVLDLNFEPSDFRNATINNPFYGVNNTVQCLHINFK